ncbi:MAG: gluconate 2-dehydrogenase subunit 3 family protein [Vicinamibacteria bacterium]
MTCPRHRQDTLGPRLPTVRPSPFEQEAVLSHSHDSDRPDGILAKRFARRRALQALGAAALGGLTPASWHSASAEAVAPATGAVHGFRALASGPARALDVPALRTLEQAVERIIPATDTPGAAAAGVHFYLDLAAEAEPETKQRLVAGLALLDARTRAAFGRAFAEGSEAEQVAVLSAVSGQDATREEKAFFGFLKARVIDAYYRSEAGLLGELQWVGHEFQDSFSGACAHPDPLVHPRRARGRAGSGRR